jgi:uncharacterized repeat protein (TIGR01451 family)
VAAQIEITPNAPCFQSANLTNLASTSTRGITNQPVISGNGARVAFWSTNAWANGGNADGNIEIFVGETNSRAILQLTDSVGSILGGFNLEPSINAAGTRIAFYSDRDLVGSNADGNFEIFLARRAANGSWSIAQITNTRGSANLFPSINADGTRIAFVSDDAELQNVPPLMRNNDRNFEIYLATIPASGPAQIRQLTDTGRETTNDQPVINAAGTRIAFAAGVGQSSQIFVWDAARNTPTQLTQSGINDQPAINTDGTSIVYIATGADDRSRVVLHTLSADGSESRAEVIVPAASNTKYRSPSISGNGARVVYVAEQGTGSALDISVFLYDRTTRLAVPISEVGGGTGEQPALSTDGTRAAFVGTSAADAGSDIYINECPLADLVLAITPPIPTRVLAGIDLNYTLVVTNNGPSRARDAFLVADRSALPGLPLNVTPIVPAGCALEGNAVRCALGEIPVGGSASVVFGYDIPSNAGLGPIVSRFTTGANAVDPQPNNTLTVTTTVFEEAALSLAVTPDRSSILAGSPEVLTYELVVNNAGPSQARMAVLTNTLPISATFVSAALIAGGGPGRVCPTSASDTQVVCQLGDLIAGSSARVQIKIRAKASAPATFTNEATVRSATAEVNLANNTVSTVTPVERSADMRITKSASASSVVAGRELTYTMTFTNGGFADTTGVVVTDLLPPNVTFVRDASPTGVTCSADTSKTTVTCNAGTLTVGAGRTARFVVLVQSVAPAGTISNTARVQSLRSDPNLANNTSPPAVTQVTLLADLGVTKTVNKSTPNVQEVVTYTVQVRNTGPSQAYTVVVTDQVPLGMSYVSHTAPAGTSYNSVTGIWTVGTLAVDQPRTLLLRAKAEDASGGATIINTATVSGGQPEPPGSLANNSASVSIVPQLADLRLVKRASSPTVIAGKPLTYTLTITNLGPTSAVNVLLQETLPSGVNFVSITPPAGCNVTGLNISCNIGTMPNGQELTYRVVITRSLTAALITNNARVSSSTPDLVPGNNNSAVGVTVNPDVPAAVVFTQQPPAIVQAGDPFTPEPVVVIRDRFGNLVTVGTGASDTVRLTPFLNAACTTPATPGALSGGQVNAAGGVAIFSTAEYTKSETIYLKADNITRLGVASACSTRVIVNPGGVSQLAFTTPPRTLVAGNKSDVLTVQRQDEFGNPTLLNNTVAILSAGPTTTSVFLTPDGSTPISSITIVTGTSSASFIYSDTVARVNTITATAGSLAVATQPITVVAAPAKDLLVIAAAPVPFTAGINSDVILVERRDRFGNPNTTDPTATIDLTSDSTGVFSFTNGLGTTQVVTLSIPQGQFTTTFRYNDTLAATHTITVSDQADILLPDSVDLVVLPAAAARLRFITAPQSFTAGTPTGVITVVREDRFGNLNTADPARVVTLTSTSNGTPIFSATPLAPSIPSVTIANGSDRADFYYTDTKAGSHTLRGASAGVSDATQTVTVTAAAAVKLAAISPARTVTAGVPSGVITIQRQDTFNNPAPNGGDVTVGLTSNSTGTNAFLQTAAPVTITQVIITNTDASFRYRDTAALNSQSWLLTFSDGLLGLADTSQPITVTAAATTKLVYVSRPITTVAGVASTAFVVERRDAFNNPNLQGNLPVNLTTSSNGLSKFFCDVPACTGMVTSVTIPNGSASIPFYYRDTLAATHVITADSGGGRTPAVAPITVVPAAPNKLVYISAQQTVTAGLTSGLLTIQLQDMFSNPITPTLANAVTVNLTSASPGTFAFRDAADANTITSVQIVNSSTASFRYTDTAAGSWALVGSSTGLSPANTPPIIVVAASASQLVFTTGPFTTQAGVPSAGLTVQRRDAFGNPNSSGPPLVVTLATTSTAPGPHFVNPMGPPTPLPGNQITIANGSSSASFRYTDTLRGIPLITAVATGVTGTAQRQTIIGTTATRLVISGSAAQGAGTTQNLTLRAFDTFNNVSDVYTGTKSLTFSGAGVAIGGQAPTVSDSGGVARTFGTPTSILFNAGVATVNGGANGVMTLYRAENALIAVTDGSINAAGADRLTVTVSAAPRTLVRAETQANGSGTIVPAQTVTAGMTVRLYAIGRDPFLNVAGAPISADWVITRTGGVLPDDIAPVSGVTSTLFTGRQGGTALVAPTFSGLTSVPSGLLTVVAGTPVTVSVETAANGSGSVVAAQNITAGRAITVFAVTRDGFGNYVGNPASATWTLINVSGGVIPANLSTPGPSASVRFTGNKSGAAQIRAAVTGVGAQTPSGLLTVVAGPATQFQVSLPAPLSYAAGITKTLAITAVDSFNNVATGYGGVKNLTFSGALPSTRPVTPPHVGNNAGAIIAFGQPTALPFNAGLLDTTGIAGDMRLFHAQTATINVGDGAISGNSPQLTIGHGTLGQMALETATPNLVAGVPFSFTTFAEDSWGNNILTYGGNKDLRFNSPQEPITSPSGQAATVTGRNAGNADKLFNTTVSFTFANGVAAPGGGLNGVMKIYKTGTFTVTVTDVAGNVPSTGGGNLVLTFTPNPTQNLALVLNSPTQSGVPFTNGSLTVRDLYQNPVTNFNAATRPVTFTVSGVTGTVTFPVAGGTNVLSGATDFSGGVADLDALGMVYAGTPGTATFRATTPRLGGGTIFTTTGVLIQPGPPQALRLRGRVGNAPVSASLVVSAGTPISLELRLLDSGGNTAAVAGAQTLTFGGVSLTGGTPPNPTVSNNGGTPINFGTGTAINFTAGVAVATGGTTNGILRIYQPGVYTVTGAGTIGPNAVTSGPGNTLQVTVQPGPLQNFGLLLASPQVNNVSFTGANSLTARDQYQNTISDFTARNVPVTLTVNGPTTATLILLGSGNDNKLEPGNFVNGVADLTALQLRYTGLSGNITLRATPQGGSPFVTSTVQINPGAVVAYVLTVSGPTTATVGQPFGVTLSARDGSGNLVTTLNAPVGVVFTGANPAGPNIPTANGTAFNSPATVNFVGGVGAVTLLLYTPETALLQAVSGVIPSNLLQVPVVAAPP